MTDRDTFAAAALTGLLAQGDDGSFSEESYARAAYRWADAMLDFRDSRNAKDTNHDAAPAARAESDEARTDKAATSHRRDGTGDIAEAQIDALECVVEDGRIFGMSVYGHLRSLLVRLRPEWECDRSKPVTTDESDRSKPISDERLAAVEELSALDQGLELKHGINGNPMIKARQRTPPPHAKPPHGSVPGEGSVPDSWNEPAAWAVAIGGGNTLEATFCGPEAREEAIEWCHPTSADRPVPLYRSPQPTLTDEERKAIHRAEARLRTAYVPDDETAATLRKLLERLA